MSPYRLPHDLIGEQQRLALMSALLDPIERLAIERLGVRPGWRCLELGSGNGSIAKTLAELVGPSGRVVASDIDIGYMADLRAPGLEVRRIDLLKDKIEAGFYDFVLARALLHHLPDPKAALGADDRCREARRRLSLNRTGYAPCNCRRAPIDAFVLAVVAQVVRRVRHRLPYRPQDARMVHWSDCEALAEKETPRISTAGRIGPDTGPARYGS